jgi:F-type H+-transporting ATPase subunit delta
LNGAVAQRYAAALADVALEKKIGQVAQRDLDSFVQAFASSSDLKNVLESPAVSEETKESVVVKISARMGLDDSVRNFVHLIVRHRRTNLLGEVQSAFQIELNARLGIAEAEVTTARELNAAEKKDLTAALERRTGKKIEAKFSHDDALLGGAVVRVGSTVFDGSVREQLRRLREQLETE